MGRRFIFAIIILGAVTTLMASATKSPNNQNTILSEDKYSLDSIDMLYVQEPRVALERLDSLRRRCQTNGWGDVSPQRLEMITAIAYRYLEDPVKTLEHCYKTIEMCPNNSRDEIWWKLMAYEYICNEYLKSENWYYLAISVENMIELANENSQYSWTQWYRSLGLIMQGRVLFSQGNTQQGIELIEYAKELIVDNNSEERVVYYNQMQTSQALAELYSELGDYAKGVEYIRYRLSLASNFLKETGNFNEYKLAHVRGYATLSWLFQRMAQKDSAALYYNKAMEIRTSYRDGYNVIEPLAKYLSESKQYNELDSLLLPILNTPNHNNLINPYKRSYTSIYLNALKDRGLEADELIWARKYIELTDLLNKKEHNNAQKTYEIVLKSKVQEQRIVEQEAENYRTNIRLALLLVFCILLLITALITVLLWKRQQKNNKFLYRQSQELNDNYQRLTAFMAQSAMDEASTNNAKEDSVIFEKIQNFLLHKSQYLNKDITSKSVQDYVGASYEALNKYFDTLVGMSCTEYILMLRLEYSCKLLCTTNMTIDAVADESGFNSSRTFYRQFKNRYNISPTVYRKVNNSKENNTLLDGRD